MTQTIIIMGVSGTGKSTIAQQLALQIDGLYLDADDFHSEQAKNMMRQGIGLTEKQRKPWIERLSQATKAPINEYSAIVLAYSGLKSAHRQQLFAASPNTVMIMLEADEQTLQQRLEQRQAHFFNPRLLRDQLVQMEAIDDAETVYSIDARQPMLSIVKQILEIANAKRVA